MEVAASILKRYGPTLQLNTWEGPEHNDLHLSFDYYCCYTEHEAVKIGQFLEGYSWTPHEVKFDKMGCVIVGYDDFEALVLLVDKESQDEISKSQPVYTNISHTHVLSMLAGTIDTELRSEYAAFIPRGNDNNNIGEPGCSFLPRRPEYK